MPNSTPEKKEQWVTLYRVLMTVCVLLVLGVVVAVAQALANPAVPKASSTYEQPVVIQSLRPLCVGELLIYDQVAHFYDTPSAFRVVSSVWSVDEQRNAITDQNPSYVNYFEPVTVKLHGEWQIPDTLKPGKYERRISTTAEARRSEMFVVPFEVAKECK